MKQLLGIALLLIFPLFADAKTDIIDSMNADSFWKGIAFKDYKAEPSLNKHTALLTADTMFIIASNRATQFDQTRFMSEDRGDDHLNYFLIFLKNGQWNVWHTSFKTAVAAMQRNHDRDWVIYTEGFGKIFTTGLYRGLNMTAQYGVNVLYLDYPSFNTSKKLMGNYYFALDNAKQAGEDFAPVFDTVKHYKEAGKMGDGKLTLFFHSMGNNMIREMVLHDKINSFNNGKWVNNLVLNSACVPQKGHTKWVDQIDFADRIYVNYNPKDATLSGANFMSLRKQLGQRQYSQQSSKAIYVNFNLLCNRNHSNFLSLLEHKPTAPAAIAYYGILFHGNCVTLEDGKCFKPNAEHKADYTILDAMPKAMKEIPDCNTCKQDQKSAAKNKASATTKAPETGSNRSMMLH